VSWVSCSAYSTGTEQILPFTTVFPFRAGKKPSLVWVADREGKRSPERRVRMATILALSGTAATLLWIVAAILVIYGIVMLVRGAVMQGVLLIIVGLLVGPGGVSIFR
jgi:hypothetical protein